MTSKLIYICIVLSVAANCVHCNIVTFPALQTLLNIFGSGNGNNTKMKDVSEMTEEELGISRGQCTSDFIDFITNRERYLSVPDDQYIQHLIPHPETTGRKIIKVNCLIPPDIEIQNSTLFIPQSVKEILEILKPIGNSTKRKQPGRCVFVFFFKRSSVFCARVAPHVNSLPGLFPSLQFAAIDSQKFPSFNTDFGVVGIPTFMLFHQGRQVVKFYSDAKTFPSFITRHTGIKPLNNMPLTALEPLPMEPEHEDDWVLKLAWAFIIISALYYFAKSPWCKQITEMMKRNWREAQMEN